MWKFISFLKASVESVPSTQEKEDWGTMMAKGYGAPFWDDGWKFQKLIVVMRVQLCEYTKNTICIL